MKKQILAIASVAFVAGMVMMTSCKKEDTTAPTITLTGGDMSQALPGTAGNGTWTEPGFAAEDDEDGNVTTNVTVTIKDANQVTRTETEMANRKGSYVITYSVSDKAGNQASVTRNVSIYNDAEPFAGAYGNCKDSCTSTVVSLFNSSVTVSDSVNNLISINNWGAFGTTINIWNTFSGTNITPTIANQSLGVNAYIVSYYPAPATTIISNTSPTAFDIKYTWFDGSASETCISFYRR